MVLLNDEKADVYDDDDDDIDPALEVSMWLTRPELFPR